MNLTNSRRESTMADQSVIHSTFVIERSYPAAPDRVFGAFADPVRKRRWFVESGGHDIEHYELDFRVPGMERARFLFKPGTPLPGPLSNNDADVFDILAV